MGRKAKLKQERKERKERDRMTPVRFTLALPYVVRDLLRQPQADMAQNRMVESYYKHDRQITESFIRNAYNAKYPNGVKADDPARKLWSRINKTLANALNKGEDVVSFDLEQVKEINTVLREWTKSGSSGSGPPGDVIQCFDDLLEYIDGILLETRKAAEKPAETTTTK